VAALSRKGDMNSAGGKIMRGATSVEVDGIPVGLHSSTITPHAPFGKRHPPHRAASTTSGSSTVEVEGCPVLKVGSGVSCGHNIVQGSPTTDVE
jgi:uncharacterized Zn-binding protein involved in type VI secretion